MSASECVPSASDALTVRRAFQCVCASRPIGTHSLDALAVAVNPTARWRKRDALNRRCVLPPSSSRVSRTARAVEITGSRPEVNPGDVERIREAKAARAGRRGRRSDRE